MGQKVMPKDLPIGFDVFADALSIAKGNNRKQKYFAARLLKMVEVNCTCKGMDGSAPLS